MTTKSISAHAGLETYAPRIIAISLLALLLLALTGCKHATTTNAEINPAGVYTLVSVDGQSVPSNLRHEGVTMTIKSGVFTINADGTCVSLMTFFVSPHPDVRREVKATYIRQGMELTMHWQGAGMTKGRINGNEFAMNNEGMAFVYRK